MKTLQPLLFAAALAAAAPCAGQDAYAPVLRQIEQNSTQLKALREQAEAQKMENRTGLAPANPEVEFGYLWGAPSAIGRRKDVSVSQSFDFPTAYAERRRLSDAQDSGVEQAYLSQRMETLLSAKRTCIELVYHNALAQIYAAQRRNAEDIAEAYERKLAAGDASVLEYNKAALNKAATEAEAQGVELERERLLSDLAGMNGGMPVGLDAASFPAADIPGDFDAWFGLVERAHPGLRYLRSQVDAGRRQVRVSQAASLPRLTVGYMGEFTRDEKYQGVTLGVSIPLWEDRNKVKRAKAAARAAEYAAEDAKVRYYSHLKGLHAQARALQDTAVRYRSALEAHSNEDLLAKALQGGELSLLNYLQEKDYYFASQEKKLRAERDLALVLAELYAAML